MLSRFCLTAAVLATVQFLPDSHRSIMAQEYEGCFMFDSSGKMVRLSELCVPLEPATSNSPDKAFIEDYKRLAMAYPPQTRDYLLKTLQNSPSNKIANAKKVCEGAKAGISLAELRLRTLNLVREKNNPTEKDSLLADMDVTISLAPNYYCPEFTNR